MNQKWKIITVLGIATLTCAMYTWGIPAIINIKGNKNLIERKIFENSGYKIDIGNPKLRMGAFPSVWIKSDNISILNPDNSKALSVDNPKLKIKLFPLLMKKIEISQLSASKEDVYFTFTKDKKFLLGQYPIKSNNQNSQFTLAKMNLNLGKYNIFLNDELNMQKVSLSGKYFKHGKYVHNKQVRFATDSTLTVGNKSNNIFADVEITLPIHKLSEDKLHINADINNFDLSSISDYAGLLTKNRIKSLDGTVYINAKTTSDKYGHKNIQSEIKTNNLKIVGKDKASSVFYEDELKANINFSTIENGINFQNTTLNSEKIHAKVNGKLFDLGNKKPRYNLTAEVTNTRLEDVVAILPGSETLLPDFNLYKLKKYIFYGNGEGKVTFEGQGNRPNVTGHVKLSDAYLIKPIKNAPANADINLKFLGKKMNLNVFVPTSPNQSVSVNGMVLIDGSKYSELKVKSTDAVLLEPAQEVLIPLHEILKFQLGPVPIMQITGIGNIDMRSAGKKIDPHIWGKINFRNATASFNEIHNLKLTNGSGEVVFNNTQTTFKTHHALINGLPIEIKGDCSVLGKLNVFVTANGQDAAKLVKVINTSPILVDVQKAIKPFKNPKGKADVFLNIYGTAKNAEEVEFNKDLFSKGKVTFHNAQTLMQDTFLPFTNINGFVNFDQYNSDYDVTGFVRNSKIHVIGTGSQSELNLKAYSNDCKLEDIFDLLHPEMDLPYKKDIGKIHVAFNGAYKGIADAENLDYNKVKVDGRFIPNMSSTNLIKLDGGTFNISNGILKTSTLKGIFDDNPYTLEFTSKDIYSEELNISDATFNFKNFDLNSINTIKNQIKLPKELKSQIDNISDIKGKIDIKGTIKNNKITADTDLKNTSFVYKPYGKASVRILNGSAKARGDILYLDKINSRISSMPVFINGKISNIYKNPHFNIAISSKPTQQFFDRFFNTQSVYPVKTKGNINLYSQVNGTFDALRIKSNLNLDENASIYYMGATISGAPTGAINNEDGTLNTNPVSINTDAVLYPNKIKLNSLKYNQTITSQNRKKSIQNELNASGEISLLKNNILGFKNLKIKTEQPMNARMFNVLFKKPTIKQGVFTTDLTINGTSLAPYITGFLNIKSIDIPLLDSTVRDINTDFQPDYINITTKANVLTNDILMTAKIVNNLKPPYIIDDINIQMDALDLNVISRALDDFEADNTRNKVKADTLQIIEPNMFIIKNAQINADKVIIKKANATNFKTHFTLGDNQILNIDNYNFNIANGTVDGDISYDLNTLQSKGSMNINDADAQIISENFFDMPGQMYGTVTGDLKVACTGISSVDCIKTLSGEGNFKVTDGRMPKLGSLEYLLKAGNLITGGITGLSINGIIDIITPLKTGHFKSISGDIHVKDGIAEDINVYSSGKDLNMYMTGSYNIASLVADMEVYGSLSKNFSTIRGKIANSSLNTLFNTIPGININEINPKSTSNINKIPNFDKNNTLRVFKADIYGDINGSNYVKSFKWIKN
ncbi:MAG: AsmA-like C-terminal region-containing protein [Candidatus Gastranaerophilaceae bacterium]